MATGVTRSQNGRRAAAGWTKFAWNRKRPSLTGPPAIPGCARTIDEGSTCKHLVCEVRATDRPKCDSLPPYSMP
jgi:hypothetical protein